MKTAIAPSLVATFLVLILSGCGLVTYPGQPGLATNGFSKIDVELLEEPGLFVYETIYDNRAGAQGVGSVITKLYPKAQTYTSNVRTNSEGTLYRHKTQYNGADIQLIAVPSLQQLHLNPNHQLMFLVEQLTSLDEVDDKNVAEESIFKPADTPSLTPKAIEVKKFRWDLIHTGRLLPNGNLTYELTSVDFNQTKFIPSKPISVETSFFQNSVQTNLTTEVKNELATFLESNFPKGYKGVVNFYVKGSTIPVPLNLGIHTLKTLEANGYKIIKGISDAVLAQYNQPVTKKN